MPEQWTYTRLSDTDSVVLIITIDGEDIRIPVAQYSGSFAINTIPVASCAVAIGRSVKTLEPSPIHTIAGKLRSMLPVKVVATLKGEFRTPGFQQPAQAATPWPTGSAPDNAVYWPDEEVTLFEGYYTGSSFQKSTNNQSSAVYYVMHLVHWLVDLGFTSFVSSISHPQNAASLSYPAIIKETTFNTGATPNGESLFLPSLVELEGTLTSIMADTDLWGAMRTLLLKISVTEGFDYAANQDITADFYDREKIAATLKDNSRAAKALARIEGPSGQTPIGGATPMAYCYGKPLYFESGFVQAFEGIARAINTVPFDLLSYTMWDVLVAYYLPTFQLDICPAIDRAVVVPRIPAWRTDTYWRTISPDEYSHVDQSNMIPKPLRAVVCGGSLNLDTMPGVTEQQTGVRQTVTGTYAPADIDSADPNAGAVLLAGFPQWMQDIYSTPANPGTGVPDQKPDGDGNGSEPKNATPGDEDLARDLDTLLAEYARSIFVSYALQGRAGSFSGKLRFDIAPGSHVELEGSPERFLAGEDVLGVTMYGQVNRVTVQIDAEGQIATTSFTLTHLRNVAENDDDRASMEAHPFYGSDLCRGLPLHASLALPPDGSGAACPT